MKFDDGYNGRSMAEILKGQRNFLEPVQTPVEPETMSQAAPVKPQPIKTQTIKVVESFRESKTNRLIHVLEDGRYISYEDGRPVIIEDPGVSVNIFDLGWQERQLDREKLQQQKEIAIQKMKRQADQAKEKARKWAAEQIWKSEPVEPMYESPKPAPKKIQPPAIGTKVVRHIDWRDD